jgi:hypothetical protein
MEITNCGANNAPSTPQIQLETASTSGTQSASSTTPNPSTYTPSSELTRLLDQASAPLEVRQDLVQAAVARLQTGYYNTQSSIEQTAQAIIQPGG